MLRWIAILTQVAVLSSIAFAQRENKTEPLPEGALLRIGTNRFWTGHCLDSDMSLFMPSIVVSADAEVLVMNTCPHVRDSETEIIVWDGRTGERRWSRRFSLYSRPVALSRDKRWLVVSQWETDPYWETHPEKVRRLLLFDASSGREVCTISESGVFVGASADGNRLLYSNADEEHPVFTVWDVEREKVIATHQLDLQFVNLWPDGKSIYGITKRKESRNGNSDEHFRLKRIDVRTAETVGETALRGVPDDISEADVLVVSDDGTWLAGIEVLENHVQLFRVNLLRPDQESHRAMIPFESVPTAVHFDKTGKSLLLGCFNGRVIEYDLASCQQSVVREAKALSARAAQAAPFFSLEPGADGLLPMAFTADGKRLVATGLLGRCIKIIDLETQETVAGSRKDYGSRCLEFSGDGSMLASLEVDGTVRLRDANTGALIRELKYGDEPFAFDDGNYPDDTIDFTADDAKLLTRDDNLYWWDLTDETALQGKTKTKYRRIGDGPRRFSWIRSFAVSPDKKHLAVGVALDDNDLPHINLWNLEEERFVREFGEFAVNLEFSPDGKLLAAGSSRGVTIWDVAEGRKLHQFTQGSSDDPQSHLHYQYRWTNDGRLASVCWDGTVFVWDVARKTLIKKLGSPEEPDVSIAWSPLGTHFITGGRNGELTVWNAMSWQKVRTVDAHLGEILSIAVSPKGDRLATASRDGTTLIWSIDRLTR